MKKTPVFWCGQVNHNKGSYFRQLEHLKHKLIAASVSVAYSSNNTKKACTQSKGFQYVWRLVKDRDEDIPRWTATVMWSARGSHTIIYRGTATASGSGDMGPDIQGVANLSLKLQKFGQPF
jgi:hypothetical protein